MPREVVYKPNEKLKPIYSGGMLSPPKFMPSYYEWLSKKGKQIIINGQGDSLGSNDWYVVPENETLFITSIFLSAVDDSPGTNTSNIGLRIDDQFIINYVMSTSSVASVQKPHLIMTQSFHYPLIVKAKQTIKSTAMNSGGSFYGYFTGFLVKNRDIPTF